MTAGQVPRGVHSPGSMGMLAPKLLDHGEDSLLGQDALAFQQLHQRRGLLHVGDGECVEGDRVFGVEFYSRALTRRVRTLG